MEEKNFSCSLKTCFYITIVSIVLCLSGLIMMTYGYYHQTWSLIEFFNSTSMEKYVWQDENLFNLYRYLYYIGPVVFGTGVFLMIVAIVVFFEYRQYMSKVAKGPSDENSFMKNKNFYNQIIEYLKNVDEKSLSHMSRSSSLKPNPVGSMMVRKIST